ncbi:hypothetical protein PC9H_000890 [Pleurotus ostreatus]|uniref:SAP domain-containing protein n=1 Tax=Pleurotus ostreatus TaxID=5322 RepID=A0A8H7A4C9_PLEOS|nr:uncharacterized protein PC9H_000890 [Pleurotus ostreatus]KAF7440544.1 hypothetical protein PC9H_000890 [Pleurotus ostreatus]
MFAVALRRSLARSIPGHRRTFVSSVLLSKTWENDTVAELRQEAKKRGLSTGNKASLVMRLQEHESANVSSERMPPPATRSASTSASSSPVVEPEAPGRPQLPESAEEPFFNVILPDAAQPEPEPQVQIPYVPDLWHSSEITESAAAEEIIPEPILPKLVVVAGEETHPGGGPSHNLLDEHALAADAETYASEDTAPSSSTSSTKAPAEQGFWGDVAEDMGIPLKELKGSISKLFS